MKAIFGLFLLIFSLNVFGASSSQKGYNSIIERGHYDFSVQGGAISSVDGITLHDDSGQAVIFPNNAIIKHCWLDVITTPDSATDTTTISIGIASTVDVLAAQAEGSFANTYTLLPVDTATTMIKLAADAPLKVFLIGTALTSGSFYVYCEYVEGD